MKVQLVQPCSSEQYSKLSGGRYQPLWALCLATYLRQQTKEIDIEILDGELIPQDELERRIDGDIIGISPTILSYENSLRIARLAPKTIMGGPHASALYKEILTNRSEVDAIAIGDGEEAFVKYVLGEDKEKIPNLAFVNNATITRNTNSDFDLEHAPIPDRSFIDMDLYFQNYKTNPTLNGTSRGATIYSQRGCSWRATSGGCIFCGRLFGGLRSRNPKDIWAEIKQLKEKYNVDFLWHESDSFTSDKPWLEKLAREKPQGISIPSMIFARADQLDQETIDILKYIDVKKVFIGIESGDNGQLQRCNKGVSPKDNLRAAELLAKNNLELLASFVLGIPGETEKTLSATRNHITELSQIAPLGLLAPNILMPIPGSRIYRMVLQHPQLGPKYKGKDILNLEELTRDYVNNFCQVDYNRIQAFAREITQQSSSKTWAHGLK